MKSCQRIKKYQVLSKEHEIYILKNKKQKPTRPILFPNQDENLNL
jgi:hypothetical protein